MTSPDIKTPLAVARTCLLIVLAPALDWTKAKTGCASSKTYLYCHPLVVTSINSRALSKVPLPVKLLLKVGTLCSDVELNVLATTVNDPGGKIMAIVTSQPKIAAILSTVATRSILGCSSTLRSV
jgi:hypothetical protein